MSWHKYGAKRTTIDGVKFDSKREASRYQELLLLERAGMIQNLSLQPKIEIQPKFVDKTGKKHRAINYIADFSYVEDGVEIIEDVKGMETAVFKLKKKLVLFCHPHINLRITR